METNDQHGDVERNIQFEDNDNNYEKENNSLSNDLLESASSVNLEKDDKFEKSTSDIKSKQDNITDVQGYDESGDNSDDAQGNDYSDDAQGNDYSDDAQGNDYSDDGEYVTTLFF